MSRPNWSEAPEWATHYSPSWDSYWGPSDQEGLWRKDDGTVESGWQSLANFQPNDLVPRPNQAKAGKGEMG